MNIWPAVGLPSSPMQSQNKQLLRFTSVPGVASYNPE
jgi:hypothetical protein